MEFLRLGSKMAGTYWGCCAVDVIQNFKVDPDAKASIELVGGDGGNPLLFKEGGAKFAGPTYRDIFWQRLRYGTHLDSDMPNHTFLAIMTKSQIRSGFGKQWLEILREAGFEFLRTVDNSVYTGPATFDQDCDEDEDEDEYGYSSSESHPNYVFALFRNVGLATISNPFVPPVEWTSLPKKVPETYDYLGATDDDRLCNTKEFADKQREAQLPLYKALPKDVFFTEAELREKGVPVWQAGRLVPDKEQKLKPEPVAKQAKASPFAAKDSAKCTADTSLL